MVANSLKPQTLILSFIGVFVPLVRKKLEICCIFTKDEVQILAASLEEQYNDDFYFFRT